MPPGGIHDAKEHEIDLTAIFDPLKRVGRDINTVPGTNFPSLAIHMHEALPFENIIHFGSFKGVRLGLFSRFYDHMSEAVAVSPMVRSGIQEFPEVARIPRDKFRTIP